MTCERCARTIAALEAMMDNCGCGGDLEQCANCDRAEQALASAPAAPVETKPTDEQATLIEADIERGIKEGSLVTVPTAEWDAIRQLETVVRTQNADRTLGMVEALGFIDDARAAPVAPAKARSRRILRKCRRGCGRPAEHIEEVDCNDWPKEES